ncbi:hypothetical protein NA56DRAFT_654349 [Hyaloscypha hepaticicola]|uniref:Uncharacterized protein n=1 Tax=Hyaloscypha hepaticicola TaxID=2082293 RepID=A0A2J6QJT9_9HELO|nr:hypothetical protein NA56DRAFT_654349 [Hyaloscypha hepaticicola]
MGSGRRNRVSKKGLVSEGSALGGSLSFIVEPYVPPVPYSQYVREKASVHGGTLDEDSEATTHSMTSVLEVANSAETDQVASIPDLQITPSSLAHVFHFLNPSSPTSQSKAEDKKPVSTLVKPPPVPLRRPHLHRTSTGKLTAIGPFPLCQESKKSLLEKEDENEGNGLVYAGYRIWNRDPRLWERACAEEMEALSDLDAALERQESDYGFDVELPPDEPEYDFGFDVELPPDEPGSAGTSSLLFPSNNDTSDGTCSIERGSEPLSFKEHDEQSFAIRPSSQVLKQTNGLNITYNPPIRSGPIFNPSLKNELKLKTDVASRPIPPHCRHLARLQFKNRMGPMWNLANKDLEEVYLHATILHESEFLDLIFCEKDEVQPWLQKHSSALTCRSQKHYYKAMDVLKNAGIPPCEIKQEVLDIFEWMTEQEQAEFIKGYRKLCALVKSSQGLHLTPSEMKHFSSLSLAGQYDFINEYKTRREERETTVRRDTEIFTAQFRRTSYESDKIPRKSASVDTFQTKFLQSGLGQEKDGNSTYSSSATQLPSRLSASPVMTSFDSKNDSASAQQTRRRATTLTGDRRARYCLLNMPTSMQPPCRDDPQACNEFDRIDKTPTSSLYVQRGSDSSRQEHYIDDCEHLALDDEEITDGSKETAQNKTYADIVKQDLKLEVMDDFPSTVPDNYFQDIDRFAASQPHEDLKCKNDYKKRVEVETETEVDSICSQPVLERSPRKEWFGEHPGVKWAIPTPPPTEYSAEGATIQQSPGNDSPLTSLCLEHSLSGTTSNSIPLGTKSEPSCADACHDVLTKGHETFILHVDGPKKRTISYVTPPRLLPRYPSVRGYSIRGSTSCYTHKNDLKDDLFEKSPRSLRKKVSTLFSSLRSRRSLGALKDMN